MLEGALIGCALTALWFKRSEVPGWFGIDKEDLHGSKKSTTRSH